MPDCLPRSASTADSRRRKPASACAGKNLRNGAARAADDFLVRIEKRPVERGGKRLSDGAFAAAGHADKNDVFHLAGQKPFNAVNFRVPEPDSP